MLLAVSGAAAQTAAPPAKDSPTFTPLQYQRLTLNTGGDRAELCLRFGANLDDGKAEDYGAHVSTEPASKPAIRIQGADLCIGGLGFGIRYKVRVTAGIVAAAGDGSRRICI
jgi:hypothetical protein